MGGKVISMRDCVFHWRLIIQNKQGGVEMTLARMAIDLKLNHGWVGDIQGHLRVAGRGWVALQRLAMGGRAIKTVP
jgi:hypothetical protein